MKQKTVKSAAKRITVTGKGKIMRRKMSAQHLVAGKSKRSRALAGEKIPVSLSNTKKIKRLVPYR